MIENTLNVLPLEKELYEAWKATYLVYDELPDKEAALIYERAHLAYEKAYDELGARWTQNIMVQARKDAGIEIVQIP
jgi:hypothetical protein